jgi:hypothetical protein
MLFFDLQFAHIADYKPLRQFKQPPFYMIVYLAWCTSRPRL